MESGLPDYQAAIDDALQLVYSQHHRLISQLHPESFRELTLGDLREGRSAVTSSDLPCSRAAKLPSRRTRPLRDRRRAPGSLLAGRG